MENHPNLEFDFFLASELGMTVKACQLAMSNMEYLRWQVYYGRKAQREELAKKGV